MTKERVTADEIEAALASRISAGVYPPDAAIPSLRDLAHELGANRNTVNKACRTLQIAGILESRPGKKGFFVRHAPAGRGAAERMRRQAYDLVWQAMAAGIPREQVAHDLSAAVERVYGSGDLRVAFYECNAHDSQQLGGELARLVGQPVDASLLDDLETHADRVAERYDLVVTTFHHLAAVNRTLSHAIEKVIGVDTRPTPEALLGIARLTSPHIGLVCTLANTAHMLKHVIYSYHPECSVDVALIDQPRDIERVLRSSDHLVATHTCLGTLREMTDRLPDVVVEFRIDEQSADYLRQRIRDTRRVKAPRAPAAAFERLP